MPVFIYTCPACGCEDRRLLSPEQARQPQSCRKTSGCGGILSRSPRPPGVTQKEVLDNGIMQKRVERDIDGPKLAYERSHKDYSKRD